MRKSTILGGMTKELLYNCHDWRGSGGRVLEVRIGLKHAVFCLLT
jgi:hypothetical protein